MSPQNMSNNMCYVFGGEPEQDMRWEQWPPPQSDDEYQEL